MFCTYNKQEVLDISKFEEDEFTTETDYSQNRLHCQLPRIS